MSKLSIRKQIEDAKKNFSEIKSKSTIPQEILIAQINSLLMLLEVIVAVLLEKKVRKTSSNSGLPPSLGFGSNGNRNKDGNSEKEKKGERLPNSRTKKKKVTLSPHKCSNCNTELTDAEITKSEERKKIDIVYEIQETTFTSETKECPGCGEKIRCGLRIPSQAIHGI